MPAPPEIRDRVVAFFAAHEIHPASARFLVGFSGGADSTCLLTLLRELGVDVVAAHLNHRQRAEADQDQAHCEAYADRLGVPFLAGQADVPHIATLHRVGLEEAGRMARDSFLRQAQRALDARWIATGHTRSDRVETILFNLARGSGLSGLAGTPETRDAYVRPLMRVSRRETESFCRARGLTTLEDPSNRDLAFARARVRHAVLPELREINPRVEDAIERLADTVREEDAFLNGAAAAALETAERPLNGELAFLTRDSELVFARDTLAALPPVLARRALRLAARTLGAELDAAQTEVALGLLKEDGAVTAEGGRVVIETRGNRVHARELEEVEPYRHPLTVPGETIGDAFGWTILSVPSGVSVPEGGVRTTIRLTGNLILRSIEPGDRMTPSGRQDPVKLADLADGLTSLARKRLPVIADMVGPVWLPGLATADRAKGTAMTLWFGPSELVEVFERHVGH